MTIKKLAVELCKREGLKEQVNIAQTTEVLSHLSDVTYCSGTTVYLLLYKNGMKRVNKEYKKTTKPRRKK